MSTDEAQERRNATWQKLKAESAALMDEVDRILSERRDPNAWENVVKLTPKAKPEPPRKYTDLVVDQMIGAVREETANQLGALREEVTADLNEIERYVAGELSSLLTETFNATADEFESLRLDVKSLQAKFVETDVAELQAEVSSLRAGLSSLQSIVGNLAAEVSALRDDVAAVERSGKVVALRGSA